MSTTLYLMTGLPGAGKTMRARQLEQDRRALRLSPDEWMLPLFGESDANGKRDVLEGRLIETGASALRQGHSVVLDFGLWSRHERTALRWLAASVGADAVVVHLFVDRLTQRERLRSRLRDAPHTTFEVSEPDLDRWRAEFEVPDESELHGGPLDAPPPGFDSWAQWTADRWPTSLG